MTLVFGKPQAGQFVRNQSTKRKRPEAGWRSGLFVPAETRSRAAIALH